MTPKGITPRFKHEIASEPGGENIKSCFACGICTASCPIRAIDERYNPRKIIRMIMLGMKERVLRSDFIWFCSTCYACTDRCPQGVKFTDVMNAVKNRAVREGFIHPAFEQQVAILGRLGRLYDIDEFDNKKRTALGLPAVGRTGGLMARILTITGLDKIISKPRAAGA